MHDECTTQRCWSGSCQFAQLEITGGTGKTALVQGAFPDLVTVAGDGDTAVARRPATFIHTLAMDTQRPPNPALAPEGGTASRDLQEDACRTGAPSHRRSSPRSPSTPTAPSNSSPSSPTSAAPPLSATCPTWSGKDSRPAPRAPGPWRRARPLERGRWRRGPAAHQAARAAAIRTQPHSPR